MIQYGYNFHGNTINVPSNVMIFFASDKSTQPNFYLRVDVYLVGGYTYSDGATFKRFFLYPNPDNGYIGLSLDFLNTLFRETFLHNAAGATNGVAILSYQDLRTKIRRIRINATEFVSGVGYDSIDIDAYVIYTNTDKFVFYEQFQPFINNKIYIDNAVQPVIRQRLSPAMTGNLIINLLDANGNVIDTPVNSLPPANESELWYFINPSVNSNLNNATFIQINSVVNSKEYNFLYRIERFCHPMGIYVYFLNRRGGMESFWMPTFNLNVTDIKRVDIMTARNITNPSYDGIDIEMISFFKNFATSGTQTVTAETYLLDEYDALALQDLVMSPFIMIQFLEDPYKEILNENPYYEAVLTDTNYVVNNYRKNKFTTKTFTFKIKRLYR